ncbi:hypothetical protein NP493_241g04006 [Ridgeia piscesae]|uniref:EGF-like domain-containing protein n=1 Tax=Ridgeia piscesae TaxID=27915 RepID=A0AAD9UDF9_RIDPI|nr:hypothetical protein NP493_241g04006 [Ridgeia piscesae]
MKKQLLQKFEAWNTDLKTKQPGTSFCKKDGCSDVSITVTNYNKDFRIKINIDRVAPEVGKDWPVMEAVTQEVLLNHRFDLDKTMPGAKDIDLLTFWIEEEVSCEDGYQAVGDICVKCTVGTFYNNSTKTCDDCPIGYYKEEEEADKKCKECPKGNTTETAGSVSSSDCIGKTLMLQQCIWVTAMSQQCIWVTVGSQQCIWVTVGSQQCIWVTAVSQQCIWVTAVSQQCIWVTAMSQQCIWVTAVSQQCIWVTAVSQQCIWVTAVSQLCIWDTVGSQQYSCPAGNFYNKTSKKCAACGKGYYQPDTGRTYCLACAIGKTTSYQTAKKNAECFDDCPSGKELKPDGSCVKCQVGTYRKKGVHPVCTPCPGSRTTPGEGGEGEDACSLVMCAAGKFRVGQGPGTCHDCPLGSYRNQSMENCTSCGDPERWRTDGEGKKSEDDCKFYCPAGFYIDGQSCKGCPKGTYKPQENYYNESCTKCPPEKNHTTNVNSTSEGDCRLGECTVGEILNKENLEQCDSCGYDSYQPNPKPKNGTECLPCGKKDKLNLGTKQERTANKSQCLSYCPAGEELVKGHCKKCQRGFYKSNENEGARFDNKGSVVSALETQFDKKNPHEVEDRVTDVLTTVVKSGSLPTPPGEHFTPVETVKTALPQVAVISDGATDCFLFSDVCITDPNYCYNGGTCKFDNYGKKAMCTCPDYYKGNRCERREDAYAKSDVPLISGTVIGLVALLFIIMFIAVSFSYRQVLSQF